MQVSLGRLESESSWLEDCDFVQSCEDLKHLKPYLSDGVRYRRSLLLAGSRRLIFAEGMKGRMSRVVTYEIVCPEHKIEFREQQQTKEVGDGGGVWVCLLYQSVCRGEWRCT